MMEEKIQNVEDLNVHRARIQLLIPKLVRDKVLIRIEGEKQQGGEAEDGAEGEEVAEEPLYLVNPNQVVDEWGGNVMNDGLFG